MQSTSFLYAKLQQQQQEQRKKSRQDHTAEAYFEIILWRIIINRSYDSRSPSSRIFAESPPSPPLFLHFKLCAHE